MPRKREKRLRTLSDLTLERMYRTVTLPIRSNRVVLRPWPTLPNTEGQALHITQPSVPSLSPHPEPSPEPRPFQPSTWKYTKIRNVLARKRGFSHSRPRVGELSVKGQTVLIFSWAGLSVCCSYSVLPFQCEINYRQYENRCDCVLKNFIYKNKQVLAPHFYLPAQIKIPTRGME